MGPIWDEWSTTTGSKKIRLTGGPFNCFLFWHYAVTEFPNVQRLIRDLCLTLKCSFETPVPN